MVHSFSEDFFLKTLKLSSLKRELDFSIDIFQQKDEGTVSYLIKKYLQPLRDENILFAATQRRLASLCATYQSSGCVLFVAKIKKNNITQIIGCSGLGPLHGLEVSEQVGEIRDLVVEEDLRRKGIGSKLLFACIEEAKKIGYKTLYLETSSNMIQAQKLFLRSNFRPIRETKADKTYKEEDPCYFLLENLL